MNRLALISLAISALALGMVVYLVFGQGPGSHSTPNASSFERLTKLPAARRLPEFSLVDQTGTEFGRQGFAGRWSVLFFGFTNCPDICPTTLYQLAQMQEALEGLPPASQPDIFMVSVDVARDNPQVMAQYVNAFDSSFSGITGAPGELQRLASALGVAYGTEAREDGGYDVLHTAALFFLNRDGDFVAIATAPHDPDALARDFRKLVSPDYSS